MVAAVTLVILAALRVASVAGLVVEALVAEALVGVAHQETSENLDR